MQTLIALVEQDEAWYAAFEAYHIDAPTLAEAARLLPAAQVRIANKPACSDSARELPRLAAAAAALPGWSFEVYDWDERADIGVGQVTRSPTIIVFADGAERGRIVEHPRTGTLEGDLLLIARHSAADQ